MSSLECRVLKLGALALVCAHDDGFVVALDDGRHDMDGGVQLRVGGRGRECWLRGSVGGRSASCPSAPLSPHPTVG